MVVLDTDHITLLDRSPAGGPLQSRLDPLPPEQVVTTIVTYEEQTRGWMAYTAKARTVNQQIEAYRRLHTHLDGYRKLRVMDFDASAAIHFQRLLHLRLQVGTMDLKIAAIVLAQDATLLSRDLGDFRKVPGLRVEDWTS